jgi:SAM-dependent methyltransferase
MESTVTTLERERDLDLKSKVQEYWNKQACGTEHAASERFTREYFDEIERHRYAVAPEIFSFAQFTRWRDKRLLEVGVGAGTDFLQWVRAGARATGVDLTGEAVEHVRRRLEVYGLSADEVRVADAESLPFPDGSFDVVYSFGVIHHTPDTAKALAEIVRVCRPGGTCKVMIYNRYSVVAVLLWAKTALLRGRPWRSLTWCLHHHLESVGTKAFTRGEAAAMLRPLPVTNVTIRPYLTVYDRDRDSGRLWAAVASVFCRIGGDRAGFFMPIEFEKRRA